MKAKIKTLSPVHIGNGVTYNKNIDFVQSGNRIGIIDERKVLNFIGEENISQWSNAIDKGGDEFVKLLKQRGWKENDLKTICSRINYLKNPDNNSSFLKEIYRTPLKGICIPGSSIKGAIKTAILNTLLTEDELNNIGIDDLKNFKGKFNFSKLDNKFFGDNANEKSTRFLKVRDAHFEDVVADVYEVQILNKYVNGWDFKTGQQILAETIPANKTADFDFVLDLNLLDKNKEYNNSIWPNKKITYLQGGIKNICSLVNDFTKNLIAFEHSNVLSEENLNDAGEHILDTLLEIYELIENLSENEMILRIGGFSGYIFTTGQWVGMEKQIDKLSPHDFNLLRKEIQKNRERKDYSDMKIWPKTRKISTDGNIFGFVKISIV